MPRRSDLDPADLLKHLPGILLVDVVGVDDRGIGDYRYRVVGTQEVFNRGHDPTGKPVFEGHFNASLEDTIKSYETVRLSKSFLYEPLKFVVDGYKAIDELSIMLPYSEDGENVSQILVFSEKRKRD